MAVLYTNNATTTLASGITAAATSLTVTSGKGALFPAPTSPDYFYATLSNADGLALEIVKVTARTTDTFTVVRGQDGTTAAAWSTGDKLELRITKSMLDDFKGDTNAALTSGNVTTALGYTPQETLVSGTNIKTINSQSLLGSGDIVISGGGGSSALTIDNKTAAYTVVAGDLGKVINCTSGTFTVSLDSAGTLKSGFNCWIWNTSTTATDAITIDPNASETIDGVATLILRRGEGLQIVCDGTNWQTGDKKTMRGYAENIESTRTKANASGSLAVAVGASALASGEAAVSVGFDVQATAARGTSIGCNSGANGSRTITGSGAMALGGSYASGTDSFAAAVANNTSSYGATAANSVAIGKLAKVTSARGVAIGYGAVVSGVGSVALGGTSSMSPIASGNYSVAIGPSASSLIEGKFSFSPLSFSSNGDAQTGFLVLRRSTTDATATVLTSDGGVASTTNQVILPNNSAYAFTGIIVARQSAAQGTASAAWRVEGLIRREANAASTVLVNSALTVIDNTPGWTLALSADTTNGGLAVTVTGAAATNIRWVATVTTSEVTYA